MDDNLRWWLKRPQTERWDALQWLYQRGRVAESLHFAQICFQTYTEIEFFDFWNNHSASISGFSAQKTQALCLPQQHETPQPKSRQKQKLETMLERISKRRKHH